MPHPQKKKNEQVRGRLCSAVPGGEQLVSEGDVPPLLAKGGCHCGCGCPDTPLHLAPLTLGVSNANAGPDSPERGFTMQ